MRLCIVLFFVAALAVAVRCVAGPAYGRIPYVPDYGQQQAEPEDDEPWAAKYQFKFLELLEQSDCTTTPRNPLCLPELEGSTADERDKFAAIASKLAVGTREALNQLLAGLDQLSQPSDCAVPAELARRAAAFEQEMTEVTQRYLDTAAEHNAMVAGYAVVAERAQAALDQAGKMKQRQAALAAEFAALAQRQGCERKNPQ